MYAQYYALEFNIILNLTSPIKVDVIWIIYSYDFIIIYENVFFFEFFSTTLFQYIFNLDLHVLLYSLNLPGSYEEKILQ